MKDWYLRQSPRDRMIVNCVAVLVVVGLIYALAWYPLQNRIANARQAIIAKTETLEFVEQGAARIRAAGGAGSSGPTRQSDKAPYLIVDEILRKAKVRPPERLEPSGANGARLQFSEVAFDRLVQVLAELELYGLAVSTLNVSRQEETGLVSARINLEKG